MRFNVKPVVCISLLTLLLVGFSCNRVNNIYFKYEHIPGEGWSMNNELRYYPEIADPEKRYDISIELRHNNDYPYQNIYFFVSMLQNDSIIGTDTLQYLLADETGRWFGRGSNALFQQTLSYKKEYLFPDTGTYQIVVRQAMRDNLLQGVEDVGIRIEKALGKGR